MENPLMAIRFVNTFIWTIIIAFMFSAIWYFLGTYLSEQIGWFGAPLPSGVPYVILLAILIIHPALIFLPIPSLPNIAKELTFKRSVFTILIIFLFVLLLMMRYKYVNEKGEGIYKIDRLTGQTWFIHRNSIRKVK